MQISTLVRVLDQPQLAADYLAAWGLADVENGRRILLELAESGLSLDLLADICRQLVAHLPGMPDPDRALDEFSRYLRSVRSPLGLSALLVRDSSALPVLLTGLSLGPTWAALLIDDPEAFDVLRAASAPARESLVADLQAEVSAFDDERSILAALARFWQRQRLRIACGEVCGRLSVSEVQQQLADVGDALVGAALVAALTRPHGGRALPNGIQEQGEVCVIALGELGARQPNYASSFELLFLYDLPGAAASATSALHDHVERASRQIARWVTDATASEGGTPARLLSLPGSPLTAAAHLAEDVVIGFDSFGRTWHRQQMLKARPVAGSQALGQRVLGRLESWLFRRYLNRADETGIQALKRRILVAGRLHQDDWRSPRLARGGIRDIEAAVEWLQLLVGGDQPAARTANTRAALGGLAEAGTLAPDEQAHLAANHEFFCRLEHVLQITSGCADSLPADGAIRPRVAAAMGPIDSYPALEEELRKRQSQSWDIIRRLLDSAFADEVPPAREVELLLDPAPSEAEIRAALGPFGFNQPEQALRQLNDLAAEQIPFLSTRRCRHLLASILPRLLTAISATPLPDVTLANVADVSRSLGGKGVLWDLLRSSPPTLDLYVKLCAACPYLSGILTTNPGMIDELVDSLQLDSLPTRAQLQATLAELCRGAKDTLPILHDFKNAEHLGIGVRDILGKEDIDRTHAALADVAETCLGHMVEREYAQLVEKYGTPAIGLGPFEGEDCRLVVLGLGKLGGREPNYHSPLDLLFLYEAEGTTRPRRPARRGVATNNNHFFTQLAQRFSKLASELTPKGRLYAVDMPLRPIGTGGAMAMTLDDLERHFSARGAPLWQWLALCQSRPVYGAEPARAAARRIVEQALCQRPWEDGDFDELRRTRLDLERGATEENLKRGPGGTLDVEFLVQGLLLKHAAADPRVLVPNTQQAIVALADAGVLPAAAAKQLGENYRNLRRVESGLRLLQTSARHQLPSERHALAQLAYLLGHTSPERLREQCRDWMASNRAIFEQQTLGAALGHATSGRGFDEQNTT